MTNSALTIPSSDQVSSAGSLRLRLSACEALLGLAPIFARR